jgi:hypothetical protein
MSSASASAMARDPDKTPVVSVDRFSATAGMLMVRNASNGLPAPNAPIDFDSGAPFITLGLAPDGGPVRYYNFDVQPRTPIPIYAFFHDDGSPVDGQLNIIDAIPGSGGYSDFWNVVKVTVPNDYVPNSVTSADAIAKAGLRMDTTTMLVNCPVVPKGSTAKLRLKGASPDLHRGWYRDQVVYYLDFEEAPLVKDSAGQVPLSPIYVTFNENPPSGGPQTGFHTEAGSMQTHNVPATLPGEPGYSPLWEVDVYDNADFDKVMNLTSAEMANILATGAADVNCPIVSIH